MLLNFLVGATPALKKGIYEIPFGESWFKSQTIKSGIVPLGKYQPALKRLIESGRAKPSFVVDREFRIDKATEAYKEFSNHDFIKCVIRLDEVEEMSPAQKKRKRNGA